jgi:hypothetical protein
MLIPVSAFAHRKLRDCRDFLKSTDVKARRLELPPLPADAGELVGCYLNESSDPVDWLVITNHGIAGNVGGARRFIYFTDIRAVASATKNMEEDYVLLHLRNGSSVSLSVCGKDLDYLTHDKFSVVMFLEGVMAHSL